MLSVGTAFAADNTSDLAVDGMTGGEPLTISDDAQVVGADETVTSDVVTKENFNNYFDETGALLSNVTAEKLTFSGEISDVGVNTIVLDRPIIINGDNAILNDIAIDVKSSNVAISGLTINQNNGTYAISVYNASVVEILDSTINFNAVSDSDGYAIIADLASYLNLLGNTVNYVGATAGNGMNNAVLLSNTDTAVIGNNKFNLTLVSASVPWIEIPAGSYNWVQFPVSEGIVIDSSNAVGLIENDVYVTYGNVSGDYDTLYAVSAKNSDNTTIYGNNITALGHSYIYGMFISGNNFTVDSNKIAVESDNEYADGIDIDGPATGVVKGNDIEITGVGSAYGIYSGMNGAEVSVNYTDNLVKASAYNVFGFSLGDVESHLENNTIGLIGNYTTGIAYKGYYIDAKDNNLFLDSSEQGNLSFWESFGVETVGIKVLGGAAVIVNNTIATAGKGISLANSLTSGYLSGNFINVVANENKNAYAIYADDLPYLYVISNDIDYQGAINGTGINNAVYINDVSNSLIVLNKFNLELVSSYVPWFEIPAGSGNWVSFPISEGIVVEDSNNVTFAGNSINVTYGDVVGAYDTIYAVDFKNSDNAIIAANDIIANGFTYIYGIIISGDNFTIESNNITVAGDYYANGIDIEGPATGSVVDNKLYVDANTSAYAIYSGMNGANVSAIYSNNTVFASAYNVFGFSLGDVESVIVDNKLLLIGNYTTGIASIVPNLTVSSNVLLLISSEQGNESLWEGFGVESVGIKVIDGNATIVENNIITQGKGVSLTGGSATLYENNISVAGHEDADAYAIYAKDLKSLNVINNTVGYMGATQGSGINNALYVNNATVSIIVGNEFDLSLVSSYVPWFEIPPSSGNWVSFPISEGIVLESDNGVVFANNVVDVTYNDVVGAYDTIYAVSIKDSHNAVVYGNNITALGHTYIYGLQMNGEHFVIVNNTIKTESDNYYANGIDIEGPGYGVIYNNEIETIGVESAYAIYSGMNGKNVSNIYSKNVIHAEAYNVFGMSLGDVEADVLLNDIVLLGNYTTGIAYRGDNLTVVGNNITLDSSEQGNLSVWEGFGVESVGIKVIKGDVSIEDNNIATQGKGVSLTTDGVAEVINNTILVVANDDADAYAVYAENLAGLNMTDNVVRYYGKTKGTGVNNAVYLYNITGPSIIGNEFDLSLVSSYVPWFEIPAGSGIWVSFPISEGIVIETCNGVDFENNCVNVTYSDVVGYYDTIYAVSVKDSNTVLIAHNNITALGHTYIYGLQMNANDFVISGNNISVESDNYYANGIDVEGIADGEIVDNLIDVVGVESAYAIYSGMNGQNVSTVLAKNEICAEAYNVFGVSSGDVKCIIMENDFLLKGNYTTGIAYRGDYLVVDDNTIIATGSNIGDLSVWESFGVENIGIKVVKGESLIINNTILTTGYYAIDVKDTAASVHDNYLLGKKYAGDASVNNAANANVYNNTPVIENKTATSITVTEVNGDGNITGIITDADGNPITLDEVAYSFDGENKTVKTDSEGKFIIPAGNGKIVMSFAEDSYLLASNATITLANLNPTVVRVESRFNITNNAITIYGYAVDKKAGEEGIAYATTLLDADGNPISGAFIQFGLNSKIYNRTTNENGTFAPYHLNMVRAGVYTLAFSFAGDDEYTSAFAIVAVNLEKKPITIKASAKTYKASAKTKKYTVTLSTIVGSSADGKAHLRTGFKVTMKINGVTYTGKTNSKGQVTFNLKITKKGKYAATISTLEDQTYVTTSKSVKITIN